MTSERSLKAGQAEWRDCPDGGASVGRHGSLCPQYLAQYVSLRPNKYWRKRRRGRGERGERGEGGRGKGGGRRGEGGRGKGEEEIP